MNSLLTKSALSAAIALTLVACGGSGGGSVAGIGGSGFTSSGSVTGFGSVFVNGVEFETDTAEFEIEGIAGKQSDLVEGMRVKVSGTINADGITGTATKVEFEDQLEGPVSSVSAPTEISDLENRIVTVLGVSVNLSTEDTVFVGAVNFDNIAVNDNIQISGFFDEAGALQATAVVEKDAFVAGTTIIEVKGIISDLVSNTFNLTVGSTTLAVDANATGTSGFANNQFVEVKGTITAVTGTSISATLIKLEDNNPAEGAEVEIEGIITRFSSASDFDIDGIAVNASTALNTPSDLIPRIGIKVEAEGTVSNGVLQANTLKLREGNVKVYAPALLDTTTTNTLIMTVSGDTVKVTINTSTELEDKLDQETFAEAIAKLDGQFLRVRGINDGTNSVIATRIRIENPTDDVILQGVVGLKNLGNNSITVLGITVEVDSATEFTDIDNTPFPGSRADFFDSLVEGTTLIKIKDKDPTNGIADEVELQEP